MTMDVELQIDGAVATLTIGNVTRKNALTPAMRDQLTSLLHRCAASPDVRAVVLRGAGGDFCSGMDVSGMEARGAVEARQRLKGLHEPIRALQAIEKPVIAAVSGVAVGYGWSLALACDLVIAADDARFGQVFSRVGLAPDGGAAHFLAVNLGRLRAAELIYSARILGAAEAMALGLVNRVVAPQDLTSAAAAWAQELARGPTFAYGLSKRMLQAAGPSLDRFLDQELLFQGQLKQSDDHKEGVAAFKEKRRPDFKGR